MAEFALSALFVIVICLIPIFFTAGILLMLVVFGVLFGWAAESRAAPAPQPPGKRAHFAGSYFIRIVGHVVHHRQLPGTGPSIS